MQSLVEEHPVLMWNDEIIGSIPIGSILSFCSFIIIFFHEQKRLRRSKSPCSLFSLVYWPLFWDPYILFKGFSLFKINFSSAVNFVELFPMYLRNLTVLYGLWSYSQGYLRDSSPLRNLTERISMLKACEHWPSHTAISSKAILERKQ